MATKFPNTTDKQIIDREQAAYEGQPPVNETGTLRAIVAGESSKAESGTVMTHHSGVIMNHDDKPWQFPQPGKK